MPEKSETASLFLRQFPLYVFQSTRIGNTVSALIRFNAMAEKQSSLLREKSHLDKLRVSSNSECVAVAGSNPKPITTTSLFLYSDRYTFGAFYANSEEKT